jgi:hypothetical protein
MQLTLPPLSSASPSSGSSSGLGLLRSATTATLVRGELLAPSSASITAARELPLLRAARTTLCSVSPGSRVKERSLRSPLTSKLGREVVRRCRQAGRRKREREKMWRVGRERERERERRLMNDS